VRELRAVLVMMPPLLAGLVRNVVAVRFKQADAQLAIVEEISDLEHLPQRLGATKPDLLIIGPASDASQKVAASIAAHTPVLTVSSNLNRILGPGPTDEVAFTPDALTRRLSEILHDT
jgi:hypothetical protein